ACTQIRRWLKAGLPLPRIALNISALQLREKPFVYELGRTLRRHGMTGARICIELTESALMDDIAATLPRLRMLCDMGIELSIDDFGTGYSSLAYLKRLPLDELKIDRSFLLGIHSDEHSAAIVDTIITMGHKLGLRIVAEGVETAEQLAFLREHGCDIYQGYFFSPPVTPEQFVELLTRTALAA
ncbi:MAG: EAL domain-containing protein, partial [Propionivibrio sp.]